MKYLSYIMCKNSFEFQNISNWIETIIDSSDSTQFEHERACENLVTNFTNKILFQTNDRVLYKKFDEYLRNKLLRKFTFQINKT